MRKRSNSFRLLITILAAGLACAQLPTSAGEWALAKPGWIYQFPRDHASHPGFKTEWWYFTGHLRDQNGERFGYQLTIFRQGIRPPDVNDPASSRFVVPHFMFAHFTVTDVAKQRFEFAQRISRGAFGEAGCLDVELAKDERRLAWIDRWTISLANDGGFDLQAIEADRSIHLHLSSQKPWAIHGVDGISQKADGEGRASHYYSGTRLQSTGQIVTSGRTHEVTGESWFDHEWATNQLTAEQAGWNWFSIQLSDGTELMLYQMRTRSGGIDPNSSGSFVRKDGTVQQLTRDQYQLTAKAMWLSKESGGKYPIEWELTIPSLNVQLQINTPLPKQELVLKPIAYWEGVINVSGRSGGQDVTGEGYMELTGYAGALVGLSQ